MVSGPGFGGITPKGLRALAASVVSGFGGFGGTWLRWFPRDPLGSLLGFGGG